MSTTDIAAVVRERLQGTLEPLRNELEAVEQRIEELDIEIVELRKLRTELRRMLAVLDPSVPIRGRKTQNGPGATAEAKKAIGDAARKRHAKETAEKRKRLEDWIHAFGHRYPEGFTITDVKENVPMGDALIARLLKEDLTDAGIVRLDHLGGQSHQQRFYKPVEQR